MGLTKRDLLVAFSSCSLLVACAATFPYRHYAYDMGNHVLLGDVPEHDLVDQVCLRAGGNQFPCMVILTDEFFSMKADYLKTKEDLIECQRGNPPS